MIDIGMESNAAGYFLARALCLMATRRYQEDIRGNEVTRSGYKEGVPSVTELLKWYAQRWPKLWPTYPPDPTGYYRKRGHFVDQCCAILAQGKELGEATMTLALVPRCKPLAKQGDLEGLESWWDYISPFRDWLSQHNVEYINSQQYVYNNVEGYQGTYDLQLRVDGKDTTFDFKTGTMPEGTRYQLALYVMANVVDLTTDGYHYTRRIGMQLQPGKCTPHLYNEHHDYAVATLMARTYHALERYR